MHKNKILFVISRYGKNVDGGAEWHCRQIAERLADNYEVEVATTKGLDYNTWKNFFREDTETLNNVKIYKFKIDHPKPRNLPEIGTRLNNDQLNPVYASQWIEGLGPYSSALNDFVVKHHNDYKKIIIFQYLYAPSFYTVKNIPASKLVMVPLAHEEPDLYFNLYRQIFRKPEWIVFNTDSEKKLVEKIHFTSDKNTDVIGLGVDIAADYENVSFREKFNIGNSDYIVFVGRLDKSKRVDVLINDFLTYKSKFPGTNLKLVLVGKEISKFKSSADIIKTGFVSEAEKYAIMSQALALVNPSPFESLSLIVLESFLVNRPVLVNGYCEVLVDHCKKSNGGLWYRNPDEFIKTLNFLATNPDQVKQMGKNGFNYVKAHYDWNTVMEKWKKILNS